MQAYGEKDGTDSSRELRLLRFCLGPDDSGSVETADDGAALVTISPAEPSSWGADLRGRRLRAPALRQAADAGLLKAACVEKQIAFLDAGSGRVAPAAIGGARFGAGGASRSLSAAHRRDGGAASLRPRSSAGCRRSTPRRGAGRSGASSGASASGRTRATNACCRRGESSSPCSARRSRVGSSRPRRACGRWCPTDADRLRGHDAGGDCRCLLGGERRAPLGERRRADRVLVDRAAGRGRGLRGHALRQGEDGDRARADWRRPGVTHHLRRRLAASASVVAARSSYLHVFSATAPRPAEQLLERALASPTSADLARNEDLLLDRARDRARFSTPAAGSPWSRATWICWARSVGVALGLVGEDVPPCP